MTFGEPVDPAYLAFRDGLSNAVADSGDRWRLRWSPRHEKWFRYSASEWVLEDLGLPDTSSEGAIRQTGYWPNTYEIQSLFLPKLWERLAKAAADHKARYSPLTLVWSPWGGGDWRSAFKRPSSSPVPPDRDPDFRDPRVIAQIKQIEEWVRQGYISADQAQKLINKVIAENLPDA